MANPIFSSADFYSKIEEINSNKFKSFQDFFWRKQADIANNLISNDQKECRGGIVDKNKNYLYVQFKDDLKFINTLLTIRELIAQKRISEGRNIVFNYHNPDINDHFIKFLDVGCGLGHKFYLISEFVESMHLPIKDGYLEFLFYGIELRRQYINRANIIKNELLGYRTHRENNGNKSKLPIFNTNALTYKNYKNYDIIYYYRPIECDIKNLEMEEKIAKDCKIGAFILPVYRSNFESAFNCGPFTNEFINKNHFVQHYLENGLGFYEKIA